MYIIYFTRLHVNKVFAQKHPLKMKEKPVEDQGNPARVDIVMTNEHNYK